MSVKIALNQFWTSSSTLEHIQGKFVSLTLQPHWRIFLLFSTSTTTKLVLRPNPLISLIQLQRAFARAAGPLWSRSGTCKICLIVLSSSRTSELGRGLDFPIVDFAPCLAFVCWDQIAWAKGLSRSPAHPPRRRMVLALQAKPFGISGLDFA